MIEVLSGISLFLGMVLKGAAITFLICFVGLCLFYIVKMTPDSACTHDCNEGRNCTCKGKQNGIS